MGQELYLSNIPFMDSISFSFLLFASYCLALLFLLPIQPAVRPLRPRPGCPNYSSICRFRTSWPGPDLTVLFFAFIDMVIDPVALAGRSVVPGQNLLLSGPRRTFWRSDGELCGLGSRRDDLLVIYFPLDRRLRAPLPAHRPSTTHRLLLGVGLYYGVLAFNLGITFWIGESLQGTTGLLMYVPVTALLLLRLLTPASSST